MNIFNNYDDIGKSLITAKGSDYFKSMGSAAMRDIITNVLLGGNVRDSTEFLTQKRLLASYCSMLKLFIENFGTEINSIDTYTQQVLHDLKNAKAEEKLFCLWLLALTNKGFDNIVRGESHIDQYCETFSSSTNESIKDLESHFGVLVATLQLGDKKITVDWNFFLLLFISIGAQTLSLRGSAKSMNGKMFEKLVLGSLLSIMGFEYCKTPPTTVQPTQKLFWLSNTDEHDRETDATIIYNNIAISIDIGFIGRGNPEITLDKVTRFAAYKHIGGIRHDMSTIIIVDTVGENSDLFYKAKRVNGSVLQMKDSDWVLQFANLICKKYAMNHELQTKDLSSLPQYLSDTLKNIDVSKFLC